MNILLTGATGFLGQHILWRLLADRGPDDHIYCLIRADSPSAAAKRLQRLLDDRAATPRPAITATRHCHAVWGDITEPELALPGVHEAPMPGEIHRIIHCAATVKFNLPLAAARKINVDGTRNVLRLAQALQRRGLLQRLDYIGTAFVAGKARGLVPEDSLLDGLTFHNSYERTKWEAEQLVRGYQHDLPIAIFRPSIVVGDSRSGYTANFRVLYMPLKLFSQGVALFAPADPKGNLDVVPIDYVVDSFTRLTQNNGSLGQSYHLAAGQSGESSIGELVTLASAFFGVRKPFFVSPSLWTPLKPIFYVLYAALWGNRRDQLDKVSHYFPYFAYAASFDTRIAEAALAPSGVEPPSVQEYFRTIMQYCVDTDWGAKAPAAKSR